MLKLSRWGRRTTWLSRGLELRQKRKVYSHCKQGWVTQDAVPHRRGKIHGAKAQLELKLARAVRDNKKGFKYLNSKKRQPHPSLDEVGHLTDRDIDKTRYLMPSSSPLPSTLMMVSGG